MNSILNAQGSDFPCHRALNIKQGENMERRG